MRQFLPIILSLPLIHAADPATATAPPQPTTTPSSPPPTAPSVRVPLAAKSLTPSILTISASATTFQFHGPAGAAGASANADLDATFTDGPAPFYGWQNIIVTTAPGVPQFTATGRIACNAPDLVGKCSMTLIPGQGFPAEATGALAQFGRRLPAEVQAAMGAVEFVRVGAVGEGRLGGGEGVGGNGTAVESGDGNGSASSGGSVGSGSAPGVKASATGEKKAASTGAGVAVRGSVVGVLGAFVLGLTIF
ncbi:hypothetical protein BT63DRAFT_473863 [Microthyrium microscopicum]|uniref:Uncharacterized protein n=1 Tax=Microthyrium microscopicum TaxID=703497 RepID=A0A6A6URP3_9PEZI|nr:hypothetical protein BT63DRAFT_473863 [Microthyrium microscopicum]